MKHKTLRTLIPILLAAAVSLAAGSAGGKKPDGSVERPLGKEDLLEISVFEIPELNRTVRVSERGSISLPLLGEVPAEGLTASELEQALRDRLQEKYLRDPQVSVFVKENGSKKVSVLGEVGKPGVYEMLGPRTLLQILSEAGGLTSNVGADLYVIRIGPDGTAERIPILIESLLVNRDPSLNLDIRPGDVISVPEDRPVHIYVDGAVKRPGRLEETESHPISLLQAIAKAGGLTDRASLKGVQILRPKPDGTQQVIQANLKRIRKGRDPDPVLQDRDVVVVSESFF